MFATQTSPGRDERPLAGLCYRRTWLWAVSGRIDLYIIKAWASGILDRPAQRAVIMYWMSSVVSFSWTETQPPAATGAGVFDGETLGLDRFWGSAKSGEGRADGTMLEGDVPNSRG